MKDLYSTWPTLFESLLPRSEQLDLENRENQTFQWILEDAHHVKPEVISQLKSSYCRDELGLPTRSLSLTAKLKHYLRKAYAEDYGLLNIVHFGIKPLVWCKKLAFTDKDTEHRLVFTCGDVVQYHNNKMGRLDQVLVHQLLNVRRWFCFIMEVCHSSNKKDDILDVPLLQLLEDRHLIGLPAISGKTLYMLPVSRGSENELLTGDDMLLWVDWEIQYL